MHIKELRTQQITNHSDKGRSGGMPAYTGGGDNHCVLIGTTCDRPMTKKCGDSEKKMFPWEGNTPCIHAVHHLAREANRLQYQPGEFEIAGSKQTATAFDNSTKTIFASVTGGTPDLIDLNNFRQ